MKLAIAVIALTTSLFASDCPTAKTSLDNFLASLPKSCRTDSDCTGKYYRANACAAPVVINTTKLSSASEKQLLSLQAQVRNACATGTPGPACSPIPFRAQCVKNACTDAMNHNTPVPASRGAYAFGTIHSSCAPWDGAALALDLRRTAHADDNAPRLLISIYKDIPHGILAAPLTVPVDIHDNMNSTATRCPKPGGCWPASSGTVTLTTFEEGKGASGTYELHFNDGTAERGKFNLQWKNIRELCG